MARRTATDFVNEVRDNAGGETAETITDTRILKWVNDAYKAVCAKYLFPQLSEDETVTTVSGTAAYEMTDDDVLVIDGVLDTTNGLRLRPISEYQYDTYTQGIPANTTGNPVFYYESGIGANSRREITLFPTPDGAYSLTVQYKMFTPLVLTPSATSMIIPEQFEDVIINRASAPAMKQLGNHDSAYRYLQASLWLEDQISRTAHGASAIVIDPQSVVAKSVRSVLRNGRW